MIRNVTSSKLVSRTQQATPIHFGRPSFRLNRAPTVNMAAKVENVHEQISETKEQQVRVLGSLLQAGCSDGPWCYCIARQDTHSCQLPCRCPAIMARLGSSSTTLCSSWVQPADVAVVCLETDLVPCNVHCPPCILVHAPCVNCCAPAVVCLYRSMCNPALSLTW